MFHLSIFSQSQSLEIYAFKNRLKIILSTNKVMSIVYYRTFFKIKGSHELSGTKGIPHFSEDMMFNRPQRDKSGLFDKILKENGDY